MAARIRIWLSIPLVIAIVALLPAAAVADGNCGQGVPVPQSFSGRLADLKAALGDKMGAPAECQRTDPQTGDIQQQTSDFHLAYWRASTDTPTFYDGGTHWALTNRGLVKWNGPAVDPPSDAVVVNAPQSASGGSSDETGVLWVALLSVAALVLVLGKSRAPRRSRQRKQVTWLSLVLWLLISPILLLRSVIAFRTRWVSVSRHKALAELRTMDPVAFENWVAQRFREMGYVVKTTSTTGDHGIDLVVRKDATFGVVQCKRWAGVVGEPVVRDLYGAMHDRRAGRAFLVTTGRFTAAARHWAEGKAIELWDGEKLAEIAQV